MTNKIVFILSFTLFFLSFPTKVLATEYEELTYDDLVSQLSTKKDQEIKRSRPTSIKSHLSMGLLNSWTQIGSRGDTITRNLNGYEIATGTDLNSDRVRGEVGLRYYPENHGGSDVTSLRELGGNLQFRNDFSAKWQSKFMGGLALRQLQYADSSRRVDVDTTSAMLMAGAGLETHLSPSVAIGGDVSARLPFGTSTEDKNALDFGIKMDTTF